jgi:hypothetical protein
VLKSQKDISPWHLRFDSAPKIAPWLLKKLLLPAKPAWTQPVNLSEQRCALNA